MLIDIPSVRPSVRRNEEPFLRSKRDPLATVLSKELFMTILSLEQRRAERSGRPFALMLLHMDDSRGAIDNARLAKLFDLLSRSTRDTDVKGWYDDGSTIGVIFTEIGSVSTPSIAEVISAKLANALRTSFGSDEWKHLTSTLTIYPDRDHAYPEVAQQAERHLTAAV